MLLNNKLLLKSILVAVVFSPVPVVEGSRGDEQAVAASIPVEPNPGVMTQIAGGSEIGAGQPALTSHVGGVGSIELEVDRKRRVYFSQNDAVHRIEADGSLSVFLQLSVNPDGYDENLIIDMAISGDYLYLAVADFIGYETRILKVDLNTRDIEVHSSEFGISYEDLVVDSKGTVYLGAPESFQDFAYSMAVDPSDDTLIIAGLGQVYRFFPESGDQQPLIADDMARGGFGSMAVLPSGNILLLANGNDGSFGEEPTGDVVYQLDIASGKLQAVAGDGQPGQDGDGDNARWASIVADDLKADLDGNYYLGTERFRGNNLRIRKVESRRNTISTIAGLPGFLSCASSADSQLQGTSGIEVDGSGIILTQSNNAILGIDTGLGSIYTLAGIYGTSGYTWDGETAFGNPMTPWSGEDYYIGPVYTEDGFTVGPDGDIFISESDPEYADPRYLRRIDRASGMISSIAAAGAFKFIQHDGIHSIYAMESGSFVRIDTRNGDVSVLVEGGSETPAVGQSAVGKAFYPVQPSPGIPGDPGGNVNDVAWDSSGNIYLSVNDYHAPDFPSGIYRIDAQTRILTAITQVTPASGQAIYGELVLDEDKGVIYYSNQANGEDAYGRQLFIPVIRLNIATGQQTRVAGIDSRAGKYRYSENPLQAELYVRDMALDADGSLLLVAGGQWWGIPDVVLRISAERPADDTLIPTDIVQGANVGASIARQGDWLAVGVPDSGANGGSTGEVLVYADTDCRLLLTQRLEAPEGYSAGNFGQEVAFAGNTMVVGAVGGSSASPQSNGTKADPPFRFGLFEQIDGIWKLERELGDLLPDDGGGVSTLATDGPQVAIGLPAANAGRGSVVVLDARDPGNATSVAPEDPGLRAFGRSVALGFNQLAVGSKTAGNQGRASVYRRDGSAYREVDTVGAEQARAGFAAAVALNDEALYVGAPDSQGGRVYDFTLGESLTLFDTLQDPGNSSNPSFGASLALEDGVLVVGSPGESPSAVKSTPPGQAMQTTPGIGAIHVFGVKQRSARNPGQLLFSRLAASAAEAYGQAVDIKNGKIVVGAPQSDNGRGSFESVPQVAYSALLSGLWYDARQDGEGFNVLVSDSAMVVYYYGYSRDGQRLWLVSGPITGAFEFGEDIYVPLYKSLDGRFADPVGSSESLVEYGLLSVSFGSTRSATFNINGFDGNKISRSTFLLDAEADAAAYSGLWYDPAGEGEGYNVISGVAGTVIYYYGSSADGERLWLISDPLPQVGSDGSVIQGRVYEANGGDFFHPAPSTEALETWGTIDARFDDCRSGRFILSGNDGNKTSFVTKLAGVKGAVCN